MNHPPISRASYMQENRKMRFEEAYDSWTQGSITQSEAALLLGQCERSFRRHIERYEADGLEGLLDKRLSQISKRRASTHRWIPDEVWDLVVTMNDATGEHTSMFFCAQEGTPLSSP